jgi:hypothetical protein
MNVARAARAVLAASSAERRVTQYDWNLLSNELSDFGCARIGRLVTPEECRQIAELYPREEGSAVISTWRTMVSAKASIDISSIRCLI